MDTFSIDFVKTVFTGSFWIVSVMTFVWWCGISFLAVFFIHRIFARMFQRHGTERNLRSAFFLVPSVLLFTLLATNRPVFPLALYSILAGAFFGALWETRRIFRLVEPNAVPTPEDIAIVERYHEEIALVPLPPTKRIMDVVVSIVGGIMLSPIFLCAAIAIWMNDPGPIIVAKHVVGRKGKPFIEYKLRSMIKQAEKHTGAVQSQKNDERIIFVGHFLRSTHLDEFPQLWNVIRGEMSLVGPRPEKVVRVKKFLADVPGYAKRHAVLPGITGWAQIHHTYYTLPDKKLLYDLDYIEQQSFQHDMKILWRTLPATAEEYSSTESER